MTEYAPNRVIKYEKLKELIELELANCQICECKNRKHMEGDINRLYRIMRIECESYQIKEVLYDHLLSI